MKVIITGATGMVGKGVLLECLDHPKVGSVLVLTRKSLSLQHEKFGELIHSNFTDFSSLKNELTGYDACFHCMGVSSVGISKENYEKLTYQVSLNLAKLLQQLNPQLVFNYVSGQGTDSLEKSRVSWARVKGKTENDLLNLGLKDSYMFRPGMIIPERGIKSGTGWINTLLIIMKPFFPLFRSMKSVTTTTRLGLAMINSVLSPQAKKILDSRAINKLG